MTLDSATRSLSAASRLSPTYCSQDTVGSPRIASMSDKKKKKDDLDPWMSSVSQEINSRLGRISAECCNQLYIE